MASSSLSRTPASALAYAGSGLFVALFASQLAHAPPPISPLLGLACHLVLLPVVATLPAPAWARAAGYVWLIIDVVLNVAAWNIAPLGFGNPELRLVTATFDSMRQGIHTSAGVWIVAASWAAPSAVWVTGILVSAFLVMFALGGPWLPAWAIYPGYALLVVWLALIGRILGSPSTDRGVNLAA